MAFEDIPTPTTSELVTEPAQLGSYLSAEATRLIALIHNLTDPTAETHSGVLQTIKELGAAAYHLSLAAEAAQVSSSGLRADTTSIEPTSEIEEVASLEPETVIPDAVPSEETTATDLPAVQPQRPAVGADEATQPELATAPPSVAPIEVTSPVAPATVVARDEAVVETIDTAVSDDRERIVRLPGEPMSNDELTHMQRVVDYLKEFDDRRPIREIIIFLYNKTRISNAAQARLIVLLEGYTKLGVLRSYGRTYGYKTLAERTAEDNVPEGIVVETNPSLEAFDKQAIAYFETETQGGTIEVNIGQFIRNYFESQRVERQIFQQTVARLNYLADQGYLFHADRSPWYGLGNVRVRFIDETMRDQEDISDNNDRLQPSNEINLNQFELTERDRMITMIILATIPQGEWFKQANIDVSSVRFSSDSAKRQAFGKLMERLVSYNILETSGAKGGKKYRVLSQAPTQQIEAATEPVTPPQLPVQPRSMQSIQPNSPIVRRQTPGRPAQTIPPAIARTPREQLLDERTAIRFADVLVRGIHRVIESSPNQQAKVSGVSKTLAEAFGVTTNTAREWIGSLAVKEHYFLRGDNGRRFISLAYVAPKHSPKSANTERDKHGPKVWTEQDIDYAMLIFAELLKLPHVQQGIEPKNMIQALGISAEDEPEFRRSLRRIAARGYLRIKKDANPNTRSDHSKKLYVPWILFTNQAMKRRIKESPSQVREEMRAMLGTTGPEAAVDDL